MQGSTRHIAVAPGSAQLLICELYRSRYATERPRTALNGRRYAQNLQTFCEGPQVYLDIPLDTTWLETTEIV